MLMKANNSVEHLIADELEAVIKHQDLTQEFMNGVINGVHKNAILVGPPGLGKSYSVQKALDSAGKLVNKDYIIVKGHVTPTQLFLILFMYKDPGKVVVLDDCDEIFNTETGLNLLKAAMDPCNRVVSYFSQRYYAVNGQIVKDFVFDGTVIVCTNIALSSGRGGRRTKHMEAITSRAPVWPMHWQTPIKKFAQIYNMVINADYLTAESRTALNKDQKQQLLKFLWDNLDGVTNLDLRLPQKIAAEMKTNSNWQQVCEVLIRA